MPKIIITMTSWKQRISTVSKIILQFLDNQTIKPDIFYLWLAHEEFQNKEKDLPNDLISISEKYPCFQIRWTEINDYCYKRWNVFPEHYEDYVISIDDDSYHSPTLIENGISELSKYQNIKTVCNVWWQFSAIPVFNNDIKIRFEYPNVPISNQIWTCATMIIPPKIFPLDALDEDITEFRRKYLPYNDESWLIPFMIKNDILTTFIKKNYIYQTISNEKQTSLSQENSVKKDEFGYNRTEKTLYLMLKKLSLIERFTKIHPGYSGERYEKCQIQS